MVIREFKSASFCSSLHCTGEFRVQRSSPEDARAPRVTGACDAVALEREEVNLAESRSTVALENGVVFKCGRCRQ